VSDSCAGLALALALLEERAQLGMRFHHVPQVLLRGWHEGSAGLSDVSSGVACQPDDRVSPEATHCAQGGPTAHLG